MKNDILVGTYHKTGTVWMIRVLSEACKKLPAVYNNLSKDISGWKDEDELKDLFVAMKDNATLSGSHAVIFEDHTCFPTSELMTGCKGFRVVRDPRDLIISAINYHTTSNEGWLHRPRADFGGKTYSEKINSLQTFEDKIRFEIEHSAGANIRSMFAFTHSDVLETVKYETLVSDFEMIFWSNLMKRMGLEPQEVKIACEAFWKESIFGGLAGKQVSHISDGRIEQWKSVLDNRLLSIIESRFSSEIDALGYARTTGTGRTA